MLIHRQGTQWVYICSNHQIAPGWSDNHLLGLLLSAAVSSRQQCPSPGGRCRHKSLHVSDFICLALAASRPQLSSCRGTYSLNCHRFSFNTESCCVFPPTSYPSSVMHSALCLVTHLHSTAPVSVISTSVHLRRETSAMWASWGSFCVTFYLNIQKLMASPS